MIEQWPAIVEYFTVFIPKKNAILMRSNVYKEIAKLLQQSTLKAEFPFIGDSSSLFNLVSFQRKEPLVHEIFMELELLVLTLAGHILKAKAAQKLVIINDDWKCYSGQPQQNSRTQGRLALSNLKYLMNGIDEYHIKLELDSCAISPQVDSSSFGFFFVKCVQDFTNWRNCLGSELSIDFPAPSKYNCSKGRSTVSRKVLKLCNDDTEMVNKPAIK
ncbi:hypothetical protein QYM36_019053 [Artemia franciscana]|uniref:Uncharacterized protein n=1 Tax=Artemia franciscana TaxID=6661 RepID=A0AA88H5R4_ARTSF|nr:hypothetical protein QYM36_019053 [Artemia franciscana]